MTDLILINPDSINIIYKNAKVKMGVPINPMLNLAILAKPVIKAGFSVKIIDFNIENNPDHVLKNMIINENPKFIGITFTTPLYGEIKRLAQFIKNINPNIKIIAGGPHATTFPEQTLNETCLDIIAVGEADFVLRDLLLNNNWDQIPGLFLKQDGKIKKTADATYITDLDEIPSPAWELYDLKKYDRISLSNRKSPPGFIETSRGCPYSCVFCNKNVHGYKFRIKSSEKVVDEIEYMLKVGFKEINILDDGFTTDLERAKEICDKIIERNLKFPWHPINGIRVDRVDKELFIKMKKAGCYKVTFGIESGNQHVLNEICKGTTLQLIENAVHYAKEAGFETFGYFMLGLPGETEESLKDTINFAKKLKLDIAKFTITIPFPGTKMFDEWEKQGLIKTKDWDKYNFYTPHNKLYNHPTLSHETIKKYYTKAYQSFYFSPSYIIRRFIKGIKEGILIRDILLFFQTKWFK